MYKYAIYTPLLSRSFPSIYTLDAEIVIAKYRGLQESGTEVTGLLSKGADEDSDTDSIDLTLKT
jgi:hypothetical protein